MTGPPPDPRRGPAPPTALVGVDWGASRVRAMRLAASGEILAEYRDTDMRQAVAEHGYPAVYQRLRTALGVGQNVPALLTGAIGSAHGWLDTGYIDCPTDPERVGAGLVGVPGCPEAHIVPGLRMAGQTADHLRGGETRLMGLLASRADTADGIRSGVVCLPGLHSRWVRLGQGGIRSFRTHMTGELFYLWQQHGVIGREMTSTDHDPNAFGAGLDRSAEPGGLMHHLFSARALPASHRLHSDAIHAWLSGLLIGHECRTMRRLWPEATAVILVGAPGLTARYADALRLLGASVAEIDGEVALARGLIRIAGRAGLIPT